MWRVFLSVCKFRSHFESSLKLVDSEAQRSNFVVEKGKEGGRGREKSGRARGFQIERFM